MKYDKYFISQGLQKGPGKVTFRLDESVVENCNFYWIMMMMPHAAAEPYIPMRGHPPHIHKDAELLFHIGTNPDDPMNLGAEVEIYMGPEMEKHVFNKTTVIYIPPNFIHAPWRPLKTVRPWIFIEVNQGNVHTEKSFRQLLPEDIRDSMNWSKWQDDNY